MIKQLLTPNWLACLNGLNQIKLGFSGGLDSTVLLHLLATEPTLHAKLTAVYINHGLSPNALIWQQHCQAFCAQLKVPFIAQKIEFDRSANIEEHARRARYDYFSTLINTNDALVLAHHQQDQAETLLLNLFRGAGIEGMAAMSEQSQFASGSLLRPLLQISRSELEEYARLHQLLWVEDESNHDIAYSRNFVRQQVMPLLEQKWPAVSATIARTASHCHQAQINLKQLAALDYPTHLNERYLDIELLDGYADERIINILRSWLKKQGIQLPSASTQQRLLDELIRAAVDASPMVSWGRVQIRRYRNRLYIEKQETEPFCSERVWKQFPDSLKLNEHTLLAKPAAQGIKIPANALIKVSYRQGGERFVWHGQTKALKKLMQDWNVLPWMRDKVPLLFVNDQLAAVIGYAISDDFYQQDSDNIWEVLLN